MRRTEIFWALLLILVGGVLLLNSLDIINVSWGLVWPVILILLGLWIIFGRFFGPAGPEVETVSIPLEGARSARLSMDHGAGRLSMKAGADSGEFLSGTFVNGLDYTTKRDGDALNVNMRPPAHDPIYWLVWMTPSNWGSRGMEWDFSITKDVPLSLTIDGGASENLIDLQDLKITKLALSTGASSTPRGPAGRSSAASKASTGQAARN